MSSSSRPNGRRSRSRGAGDDRCSTWLSYGPRDPAGFEPATTPLTAVTVSLRPARPKSFVCFEANLPSQRSDVVRGRAAHAGSWLYDNPGLLGPHGRAACARPVRDGGFSRRRVRGGRAPSQRQASRGRGTTNVMGLAALWRAGPKPAPSSSRDERSSAARALAASAAILGSCRLVPWTGERRDE